ncbi:MAG: hypothetical protein EBU12_05150 [Microbacteriaceae bacterium]|nr:hypothetical protein [Microbacteriaceae bacterium]
MAVKRFELDLSKLDDAAYGLNGPSGRSFILDSSQLDGADVLNGSPFLTTATAASSLGGLSASVSATVTEFAVLSAPLGGLNANASATVNEFAVLSASLGGLNASVVARSQGFAVFTATLGGMSASATAVVIPGAAPPSPNGGRRNYPPVRRKKVEPLEPNYEPVPVATKVRYTICSTVLGSLNSQATGSITFSILDDDAEILLMV